MTGNQLRRHVLTMVYGAQSGHIGASFSIADLIAFLYNTFDLAHIANPEEDRDILVLSKGHAVPAVYAALYEKGVLSNLSDFRALDSPLQGHPDRVRCPYIHATTGSLGQGLSIACGHALAMKLGGSIHKVFCIIGDGEMQEGQNWEALMFAAKYRLSNLVCIMDWNMHQNDGRVANTMPYWAPDTKFVESFTRTLSNMGWLPIAGTNEHAVDTDFKVLTGGIKMAEATEHPLFLILSTKKGEGVSFMRDNNDWHSKVPTQEEFLAAIKELSYRRVRRCLVRI
mgnify:FL=1